MEIFINDSKSFIPSKHLDRPCPLSPFSSQASLGLLGSLLGLLATELRLGGGLHRTLCTAEGGDALDSGAAEVTSVAGLGSLVGNGPVGPGDAGNVSINTHPRSFDEKCESHLRLDLLPP